MGKCPYCHCPVPGSIVRHLARCHVKQALGKRSPPPVRRGHTPAKGSLHLTINAMAMHSRLAGDTHFATPTRPSDLLHSKPSLQSRAASSRDPLSQSAFISPPSSCPHHPFAESSGVSDWLDSPEEVIQPGQGASFDPDPNPCQPPGPNDHIGEPQADAAFMCQFAPFIDPDAHDPFSPSNFSEKFMRYERPLPSK